MRRIEVMREGTVWLMNYDRPPEDQADLIGFVDKHDRTGRKTRTWRAVVLGGRVATEGLRTRREAVAVLAKINGVCDES